MAADSTTQPYYAVPMDSLPEIVSPAGTELLPALTEAGGFGKVSTRAIAALSIERTSDNATLAYPVGSMVMATSQAARDLNAAATLYRYSAADIRDWNAGGSALAGTWRTRGVTLAIGAGYFTLYQRVS